MSLRGATAAAGGDEGVDGASDGLLVFGGGQEVIHLRRGLRSSPYRTPGEVAQQYARQRPA